MAGLTYTEMQELTPGFIMDCYLNKYEYDLKMNYPKAAKKIFGG